MPYQKINGAGSEVVSYATGLLTVTTGTGGRFGTPTAEDPLLLQTGAAGVARASAYLVCTGRTGDVLTVELQDVEGTPGTIADGDFVAAGEAVEFWTEVYDVIATKQAVITLTTTGTGGPATLTDDVLNIPQYDAGESGGITALTGDVTASGPGSAPATLKTVNSNVGTWNTVTVNAKGLVTSASNASYVTTSSLTSALSGYVTTSALTSTLADYATVASLSSYVTTSSLTSTLGSYATTSALSSHTGNTSNPHGVTKSQVGLGSVDNTSDLAKPISTLTQAALDDKQDALTLTTTGSSGPATLAGGAINIPVYSGGSPGGSDGAIQYNNAGSLGGSASVYVAADGLFAFADGCCFAGPFDENATALGVYAGVLVGSPRVTFVGAARTWQIDSYTDGTFRWYTPGAVHMVLDPTDGLVVTKHISVNGVLYRWPSTTPTAGQVLTVDSVTDGRVVLKWM